MKILKLAVNNLASIAGEHEIDFEQSPLSHAGLIAITGKTGAGKSTLLDAMCLALYNEIPRLRGATGSLKDTGGQDISIKDSKNILRRGSVNGYAQLEFQALDGKRYAARWDIKRARNKVDGNLKVDRSVTCLDDQCVLTQRLSECTPLIEQLVGLSFEQFTRAVLLAQSEVGAFLKAKDSERADLLEYLTNSHIFSLVSQKAAEKNSEIKQQRSELENLIGHIEMLSEEELSVLHQQHTEQKLKLQDLVQSEKLLENERKWHLEQHKLHADVQAKKEVYEVQLDAVNKLGSQQQLLQQLDHFQAIREQFVQYNRLLPQKQQLLKQQAEFKPHFESLKQQVALEQQALSALEQQQHSYLQHIENIKPHLQAGLKLDHAIQTISEQYKKLSTEQNAFEIQRLQPLQQQLAAQQTALQHTQTQQRQVSNLLTQTATLSVFDAEPHSVVQRLQNFLSRQEQLHAQYPTQQHQPLELLAQNIADLHAQCQALTERYQNLSALEQKHISQQKNYQQQQQQLLQFDLVQQKLAQILQQQQQLTQLEQQLSQQQELLAPLQHSIQQDEHNIGIEQQQLEQLEKILQQQRLLHNQSVQELRLQLKPDEPCMVCGSEHHPFAENNHELLEQGLVQLQEKQLQQAKQQLLTLQKAQQNKQVQLGQLNATIEQLQQQITQSNVQMQQQNTALRHALTQLNVQIAEQASFEQISTQLSQQYNSLQQQIQQQQAEEQQLQSDLQQWRSSQQQLQQLQFILQQRQQLAQLLETVTHPLKIELAHESSESWSIEILGQLQKRIEYLQQQKQIEMELEQKRQQLEKTQYQYDLEQQNFVALNNQLTELVEHGKTLRQQLADLTLQYAGQSYRIAAEWRDAIDQQTQILSQNIAKQAQRFKEADHQLNQANLKRQDLITQLQQVSAQIEHTEHRTQNWQLSQPQVTAAQIEHWLAIDLATHQQIRHDINTQLQLLENAKTAWQLLEEQYQAHLQQQPEDSFEVLEQKLSELQPNKTLLQDGVNDIAAKLKINSNSQTTFAKYQTQIEKIKAEEYRWGRIYDLIGHKEGTKFQKIAQEYHLDILVEYANQQLQPLAPRYQLHRIANSLSLAIIDLDMNNEVRPVLSLSGGETFLVSLALALAIANMAAGSMKLESLFIDEGFGTLDPASLHMVMNALDHLQNQGRKVVLISHIQEMHERIPVQIQVQPVGAGASRIEIVG